MQPKRRIRAGFLGFLGAMVITAGIVCAPEITYSASPFKTKPDLEAYLQDNSTDLRRELRDYNREHEIVASGTGRGSWKIMSFHWDLKHLDGDVAFLEMRYQVGDAYGSERGGAVFELAWSDGELHFVTHYSELPNLPATSQSATEPSDETTAPISNTTSATSASDERRSKVENYLESNEHSFGQRLAAYNRRHRITISNDPLPKLRTFDWVITKIEGDQITLGINFMVGNDWNPASGRALFDLEWRDGELVFKSHRTWKKDVPAGGGMLADSTDRGCIYNYYTHRPCIDTLRKWREFTEFNDLPMNPQSAQIFQAYKHSEFTTGDRLLARARGQPDPTGETVFGLQAEITALNLRQY